MDQKTTLKLKDMKRSLCHEPNARRLLDNFIVKINEYIIASSSNG